MRIVRWLMLVAALLMGSAQVSHAEMPKWLGLGSSNSGATKKTPAAKSTTAKSSGTKSSGMVDSLTSAPKRLVSSTKGMLTPKKTVSKKSTKSPPNTTQKPARSKDEKPGFFQSLVNPEPPPPPRTVKEWMELKQIHP